MNLLIEESSRLYESGDLTMARELLEKAVSEEADSFQALYNLGVVLRDLNEWDLARKHFERALLLQPHDPQALNNLGLVHENVGDYPGAMAYFRAALSLAPGMANAEFNLALCLLRLGHFNEGFARFEARFGTGQVKALDCPHPRWEGQQMLGTLLIHTEQGAGDAMQFVRYLPMVAERVSRILFVCPERLMRLFSSVPGISEMRSAGQFDSNAFQTYCPLLSLPRLAGTTVDTIPDESGYLKPPADKIELPPAGLESPRLRVGLCWAGSRTHLNDKNRSAALADFEPLFGLADVAFYSLQIDESNGEREAYGGRVVDMKDLQKDWADAASLVSQLDLVIAVDTGVAHLAAALGVPTWIALSKVSDWRWLLGRDDSPWYPSVRLFRQTETGDWTGVVGEMRKYLEAWPGLV